MYWYVALVFSSAMPGNGMGLGRKMESLLTLRNSKGGSFTGMIVSLMVARIFVAPLTSSAS